LIFQPYEGYQTEQPIFELRGILKKVFLSANIAQGMTTAFSKREHLPTTLSQTPLCNTLRFPRVRLPVLRQVFLAYFVPFIYYFHA
jgi:hypothetical protein